jgi:hypothetical protein
VLARDVCRRHLRRGAAAGLPRELARDRHDLRASGWEFDPAGTLHWAGGHIYDADGPLAEAMENDLWAWVGVGFDGSIVRWIEIGEENETFFAPARVRSALRLAGLERQDTRVPGRESWALSSPVRFGDLGSSKRTGGHIRKGTDIVMGIIDHIRPNDTQATPA